MQNLPNCLISPQKAGKTSKGSVSVAPNHAVIWSTVSQGRVLVPGMEGVIWSGESGTIACGEVKPENFGDFYLPVKIF
jgi:hypothetical protein